MTNRKTNTAENTQPEFVPSDTQPTQPNFDDRTVVLSPHASRPTSDAPNVLDDAFDAHTVVHIKPTSKPTPSRQPENKKPVHHEEEKFSIQPVNPPEEPSQIITFELDNDRPRSNHLGNWINHLKSIQTPKMNKKYVGALAAVIVIGVLGNYLIENSKSYFTQPEVIDHVTSKTALKSEPVASLHEQNAESTTTSDPDQNRPGPIKNTKELLFDFDTSYVRTQNKVRIGQ